MDIVRTKYLFKLQSIVCMALILGGCMNNTPEWTESDEKWWNQSSDSPISTSSAPKTKITIKQNEKEKILEDKAINKRPVTQMDLMRSKHKLELITSSSQSLVLLQKLEEMKPEVIKDDVEKVATNAMTVKKKLIRQ